MVLRSMTPRAGCFLVLLNTNKSLDPHAERHGSRLIMVKDVVQWPHTASCAGVCSIEARELTDRSSHGRERAWPPGPAQAHIVKIMLKLFKSKPALTFLGS